jgi:hypothetical protein
VFRGEDSSVRCYVRIERIGDWLYEEILQIVLVEHIIDIDCPVEGVPGRVPVGIAFRGVAGIQCIGWIRSVRVCHVILLQHDTRRIDAEMVVR